MSIKAYKAFGLDWKCLNFQFKVGQTYKHEGAVSLCQSGFHACEAPLDVLSYYPLASKFAEVELDETQTKTGGDTKLVGASISIKSELTIGAMIEAHVGWVSKHTEVKIAEGDASTAASSGYSSRAASSGDASTAASSGYYTTAASSGDASRAASSGNSSKAASSGDYSAAASSGDYSAAASSGDSSRAASSGYYSAAASSGNYSAAASSGYYSAASADGEKTIAMVAGLNGQAKAGINGAFALAWQDGEQMRITVGTVGKNKIKPDTWYKCDDHGKLVEVK